MNILTFIDELRNTDGYIRYIYTEGGCYRFHILLKKMYKDCTPYISQRKNHIVTRYKNRYYDIDGEVKCMDGYTVLTVDELPTVERWSFRRNNMMVLTECPVCEEPLVYDSKNNP
jgi:uncharacterized protein YbaR (Trm112 family)